MSKLKELLRRHDIKPKKSLGQNFVSDGNTIKRILEFAKIDKSDLVVEVGAGCGALTLGLAEVAKEVLAIETDSRLLPPLTEVLGDIQNVHILCADVTKLNLAEVLEERFNSGLGESNSLGQSGCKLVANLPYNISTRLILSVLSDYPQISELVVMVQKEVGERLLSEVNGSNFSLVSLKAQFYGEVSSGGNVAPTVFYPVPAVDSKLIRIVRRQSQDLVVDLETAGLIFDLAREAFSTRRKMLRKSLRGRVGVEDFVRAGVPETARPQELSFSDWHRLFLVGGH